MYQYATDIRRGNKELCINLPGWPANEEPIEIGLDGAKRPILTLTRAEAQELSGVLSEMSRDPLPEDERERLVAEIQAMTPAQIDKKLKEAGVQRGSQFEGYEPAKKVIFQGLWLDDSAIYDRHLKVITMYLGLN